MQAGEKRECAICHKEFEIKDNGWTRKYCYECSPSITNKSNRFQYAQNLMIKRHAIKKMLIDEAGGKCSRCGYNKSMRALEFHHLDPAQKDFGISKQLNRNLEDLRSEIKKCVLLCSNCHAEVHDELYAQGFSQFNPDI